jgi:uncharacterized protein (DUF1501 family)
VKRVDRRQFLRFSLGAGAAVAGGYGALALSRSGGGHGPPPPVVKPAVPPVAAPVDQRLLVVVEMAGGNDGLSMIVPYTDQRYAKLRPQTAIDPSTVLTIDDHLGFHPGLAHTAHAGAAVITGVGVDKPDLSHFEMLRRWWTADPDGTDDPQTGFLGRLCDVIGDPGAPAVGVSLGSGPTPALVSEKVVTLAMDPSGDGAYPTPGNGDGLDRAWLAAQRAMAHPDRADAAMLGTTRLGNEIALRFTDVARQLPRAGRGYPDTDLGAQLRLAARLLAGDVGIRVVHVPYDADFDTHEGHNDRYPKIVQALDAALAAFQRDLEHRGLGRRVLIATISEFGRRVPDNGSSGLDHGAASTALMLGPVRPGVYGEQPSLGALDENDNLRATVPMAHYYATIAEEWLGVPAREVLPGSSSPLAGIVRNS